MAQQVVERLGAEVLQQVLDLYAAATIDDVRPDDRLFVRDEMRRLLRKKPAG